MAQTRLINDVTPDMLHFHPIYTKNMAKMVDISLNKNSVSYENRLVMQLCEDSKPLIARWTAKVPENAREDEKYKRSLDLAASDKLIEIFEELDELVIETAVQNAREWFKKDLNREQVLDKYQRLIRRKDEEGEPHVILKVKNNPPSGKKWKCLGKTPPRNGVEMENDTLASKLSNQTDFSGDDYKIVCDIEFSENTFVKAKNDMYYVPLPDMNATAIGRIVEVDDDGKWLTWQRGSVDDLTKGSEIVPVVKLLGIWFSMDKFGISLQADSLLVKTHHQPSFMDSFVMSVPPAEHDDE
jgi:hypothetical protein